MLTMKRFLTGCNRMTVTESSEYDEQRHLSLHKEITTKVTSQIFRSDKSDCDLSKKEFSKESMQKESKFESPRSIKFIDMKSLNVRM